MKKKGLSFFNSNMSKQHRIGVAVLLLLILGLIIIRIILNKNAAVINDKDNELLSAAWEQFKSQQKDSIQFVNHSDAEQEKVVVQLFPFNPNIITKEDLSKLGLKERTINTWLKYRDKGGKFYKKEDIKKLYNLPEEDYESISPYIVFNNNQNTYKPAPHPYQKQAAIINLNTADTSDLKKLKGIGSVLAARIITFRDALGGFCNIEQLKEVYHLPDSIFTMNKNYLVVDINLVKKINLNQSDYQAFYKHPYLRPYAKQIIGLRKKLEEFDDIEQLKEIKLINEEKYRKIAPYLTI